MDEHEDQEHELQLWDAYEASLQHKSFPDALEEVVLMMDGYRDASS